MSEEVAIPESQGLQLLAELERTGAITETSLTLPPETPYGACDALAAMLGQLHRMNPWLLGDLLLHMEKVWGETYAQAAHTTGLAEQTLQNYTSTCNRIPRSRRRKHVPFSVHSEVAWLTPREQEEWLRRVSREGMTRERVREELAPLRAQKRLERMREKLGDTQVVPVDRVPDLADTVPGRTSTDLVRNGSGIPELPPVRGQTVEVLPPAVSNGHICHCVICGRAHRSDIDVT